MFYRVIERSSPSYLQKEREEIDFHFKIFQIVLGFQRGSHHHHHHHHRHTYKEERGERFSIKNIIIIDKERDWSIFTHKYVSEKESHHRSYRTTGKGNLDDVTQWLLMVVQAGDSSALKKALETLERFPAVDDYLKKRNSETTYRPSTSSSYGPIRSVHYIINRPLPFTPRYSQTYNTYLLCEACKRNCLEIVKLLIGSGASVDVMDGKGTIYKM